MRLAVFTNQFPGPVSTFFARDMRGLIDAGIDINVFAIYPYEPELWRYVPETLNDQVLPRNKVHHITFRECLSAKNLRPSTKLARLLREGSLIGASAARYGAEPFGKSMYVLIKAWNWALQYGEQYDHVLAYWGNYAASCAYLFHRVREQATPFSLFLHAGLDLYRNPVFMRQKLLYADNIITCSDFNDRFIQTHYSDIASRIMDKVYVHHHGLDLNEFSFEENGRRLRKIIAVGRLEKAKGFDYLIRSVDQVKRDGIPVELDFIGDGSQEAALKALTAELGLDDAVNFRGWVTPNEVRKIMQKASLLVHPSAYLGDGVPNVIKECMALGTPVIATAIAGIPELLGNGKHGFIVPPQDVPALAEAIKSLLSDEARRLKLADSARRYVEEKFDMHVNGLRLAELLYSTKRK